MDDAGFGEGFAGFHKTVPLVKADGTFLGVEVDGFLQGKDVFQDGGQETGAEAVAAVVGEDGEAFELDALFGFAPAGGGDGFGAVINEIVAGGGVMVIVFENGVDALFADEDGLAQGERGGGMGVVAERETLDGEGGGRHGGQFKVPG